MNRGVRPRGLTMRIRLQHSSLFRLTMGFVLVVMASRGASADKLPIVTGVEFQPLSAQVKRVAEALEQLGQPLPPSEKTALAKAVDSTGGAPAIKTIQEILDRHVLVGVEINAESRVKAAQGAALPHLVQNGWTVFLVKINNQAGVTAPLVAESPNAALPYRQSTNRAEPKVSVRPSDVLQRWADVAMYTDRPLKPSLSGLRARVRHHSDSQPRCRQA